MNNKKGFSYVLICVIVLLAVAVIAVAIRYAMIFNLTNADREDRQLAADSLLTQYASTQYNAVKQGSEYEGWLDREGLVSAAYDTLGFPGTTQMLVLDKGDIRYIVMRPEITPLTGDTFGVKIRYTIRIPFEILGIHVTDITAPISIVSLYAEKW